MSVVRTSCSSTLYGNAAGDDVAASTFSEDTAAIDGWTRQEVEDLVQTIWEDVLDIRPIERNTSFHTLDRGMRRALNILQRVEEAIGMELPLSIFSAAPTIGGMTDIIMRGGSGAHSPIVEMKTGKGAGPLFFIPGLGGLAFELFHLVQSLDYPGSIYILQMAGLDGTEEPPCSVVEMALSYAATIKRTQPDGPYKIVGYCFGGCFAMEVARQLTAEGQHVEFLGMIESPLHEKTWPLPAWLTFKAGEVLRKATARITRLRAASMLSQTPPPEFISRRSNTIPVRGDNRKSTMPRALLSISSRFGMKYMQNNLIHRYNKNRSLLISTSPYYVDGLPRAFQRVRDSQLISFFEYAPERYPGKATYFRTPVGNTLMCDPKLLWSHIIENIVWQDFKGDHQSMLRHPYVEDNAQKLLASLMGARN